MSGTAAVINFREDIDVNDHNHSSESVMDLVATEKNATSVSDEAVATAPVNDETKPSSSGKKVMVLLSCVVALVIGAAYVVLFETPTAPSKNTATAKAPVAAPAVDASQVLEAELSSEQPVLKESLAPAAKEIELAKPEKEAVLTGDSIPELFPTESAAEVTAELDDAMRAALYDEDAAPTSSAEDANATEAMLKNSEATMKEIGVLKSGFEALNSQFAEQSAQINATNRAITQTAQLIVSMKDSIENARRELIQVRTLAYENQDRIMSVEKKYSANNISRNDVTGTTRPASASTERAPKATEVVTKPVVKAAAPAPAPAPEVSGPVVLIDKLWVVAIHGAKAVVIDGTGKQYLLQMNQGYTNLGKVTRIDETTSKVYGVFEDGTNWLISKR